MYTRIYFAHRLPPSPPGTSSFPTPVASCGPGLDRAPPPPSRPPAAAPRGQGSSGGSPAGGKRAPKCGIKATGLLTDPAPQHKAGVSSQLPYPASFPPFPATSRAGQRDGVHFCSGIPNFQHGFPCGIARQTL